MKPLDYKHIAAWGRLMGSFAYYIHQQQEEACAAGAPINAIYQNSAPDGSGLTGVWSTADEIQSDEIRARIESDVANMIRK